MIKPTGKRKRKTCFACGHGRANVRVGRRRYHVECIERHVKAVRWALGEGGGFRSRALKNPDAMPPFHNEDWAEGPYYWRRELRDRALGGFQHHG